MVLSSSQHLLLFVSLALCACFLLPRMFGGEGVRDSRKQDSRRVPPPMHGRSHRDNNGKNRMHGGGSEKNYANVDQMKGAMEQELKAETMGSSQRMAFTLMPIYAVGVALFAAYKFTKIKSKENSKSKSNNEGDKKAMETENQLMELEHHLSQTEEMLHSLLTQLDPLSNCVTALATEQKDEIMNQLQSIRQLMKKSGMDKSAGNNPANQSCEDTLEDLIDSFKTQNPDICEGNENEESIPDAKKTDGTPHEGSIVQAEMAPCEGQDSAQSDEADVTSSHVSEGLRKRNVKE